MVEQGRSVGVLVRRGLALTAVAGFVVIFLGCMSLTIGGRTESIQSDEGCIVQHGEVSVPAHQELDVYYPIPYPVPPNLTITTTFSDCQIIAQAPDRFRVKNDNPVAREVTWKSRGIRMPTPIAPVVGGPPPPPVVSPVGPGLPPSLPAEPLPISSPKQ